METSVKTTQISEHEIKWHAMCIAFQVALVAKGLLPLEKHLKNMVELIMQIGVDAFREASDRAMPQVQQMYNGLR